MSYLQKLADTLIANGYRIVPVEGKRPHGNNWQHADYKSYSEIEQALPSALLKKSTNVGILCNRTEIVGLDIDVYDSVTVAKLVDFLVNIYGDCLLFRYGERPKVLIPFRYIGTDTGKRQTAYYDLPNPINDKQSRIELIRGGQFVAFGEYQNDAGETITYQWEKLNARGEMTTVNASLEHNTKTDLPVIDERGISDFFNYFEKLCYERGFGSKPHESVGDEYGEDEHLFDSDKQKVALPLPEIKQILREVHELDETYVDNHETWLSVGMALWHQTDGSHEGYKLWINWSKLSDKFNEEQYKRGVYQKRWDSFDPETGGSDVTTVRSILYKHSQLVQERDAAQFNEIVSSIEGAHTTAELDKTIRKIATTKMTPLMRESLISPIKRAYKNLNMEISSVAIIRRQIAYDMIGGEVPKWLRNWVYVNALESFFNTQTKELLSPFSFDANYNKIVNIDSEKQVKAHRIALDLYDIPKVKNLRYEPSDSVFVVEDSYTYANTYRLDVLPEIPDELSEEQQWGVDVFKRHILNHLIDDKQDAETFMAWLAWVVQNTGKLCGWACVLQGVEGDGKTTIANIMQYVLGRPNVRIIGNEVVQGSFKSWVAGHVFCVIEEITVTGRDKYQTMNNLKQYITNPEVDLHKKGENAEAVRNFSHYLFLTNDPYALPITENDRRYFFASSRFQKRADLVAFKKDNPDYYRNLIHVRNNPNLYAGAIRKYLMEYEIPESFSLTNEAPMNKTKRRVIQAGVGGDEIAILSDLLSRNKQLGFNKKLFNQTAFAREYVDGEKLLSLRKRWKNIFAEFAMYPITGFVQKDGTNYYFYSDNPSLWTVDGTPDGLIDKKRVREYIVDSEDGLFDDDELGDI